MAEPLAWNDLPVVVRTCLHSNEQYQLWNTDQDTFGKFSNEVTIWKSFTKQSTKATEKTFEETPNADETSFDYIHIHALHRKILT